LVIFVDTNVLIDLLQDDPRWKPWSLKTLIEARSAADVVIDAIVIAELSRDYQTLAGLQRAIAPLELTVIGLDEATAFLAGHRFLQARDWREEGEAKRPLADFFIGAHALSLGIPLVTRDPKLYRRYFPDLTLITPETHP
jgi:predicted nucleic acid-binding protein